MVHLSKHHMEWGGALGTGSSNTRRIIGSADLYRTLRPTLAPDNRSWKILLNPPAWLSRRVLTFQYHSNTNSTDSSLSRHGILKFQLDDEKYWGFELWSIVHNLEHKLVAVSAKATVGLLSGMKGGRSGSLRLFYEDFVKHLLLHRALRHPTSCLWAVLGCCGFITRRWQLLLHSKFTVSQAILWHLGR